MGKLDGKIALVTGASQGIGLAIARGLAKEGATLALVARNAEKLNAAVRSLTAARSIAADGATAEAFPCDLTDEAQIDALFDEINSRFGRLDLLVNNAAISNTRKGNLSIQEYVKISRASTVSLDEVRSVWETNLFGVLAVYQAMLPLLRESSDARIVNVSSGVGSLTDNADPAHPYHAIFGPVYPASKTALNAMTVAMAIELESTGIKVNAVSPGYTRTNLNNYSGTETVEEGAAEAVRVALLGPDSPTGTFTHATRGTIPW